MKDLSTLAYKNGTLAIAAFDHRRSLLELLNPKNPETVPADQVVALKRLFIQHFSTLASAVLIDPIYGLDYGLDLEKEVPSTTGLIMSLEASDYADQPQGRLTQLLPHWGVADLPAHRSAAKLLLYYHPSAPVAPTQLQLVAHLSSQCRHHHVIFLVEPIIYGIGDYSSRSKLDVTLKTIDQLNPYVDILKLEFPLTLSSSPEPEWYAAARALSRHAAVPWLLLSRGLQYPAFKKLSQICCASGAAGIAVGRAVWQELEVVAARYQDQPNLLLPQLEAFLINTAHPRFLELIDLVKATARPWDQSSS